MPKPITMTPEQFDEWKRSGRFPDEGPQRDRNGTPSRYAGLRVGLEQTRGKMNKTEEAYARELDAMMQRGEVAWWHFEAIKLRLTDQATGKSAWFTVDFWTEMQGCQVLIDVKGGIVEEAALLRAKMAATLYPQFYVWLVSRNRARDGGGWLVNDLSSAQAGDLPRANRAVFSNSHWKG